MVLDTGRVLIRYRHPVPHSEFLMWLFCVLTAVQKVIYVCVWMLLLSGKSELSCNPRDSEDLSSAALGVVTERVWGIPFTIKHFPWTLTECWHVVDKSPSFLLHLQSTCSDPWEMSFPLIGWCGGCHGRAVSPADVFPVLAGPAPPPGAEGHSVPLCGVGVSHLSRGWTSGPTTPQLYYKPGLWTFDKVGHRHTFH